MDTQPASQQTAPGPPLRRARFHLLFICLLVIGAGNSMLSALLPPLVRRLHLPDSSIGWIFSLSAVLWVLTSPIWGRLSDRTGRKPIIAAGLFAYCLSMGSFALVVTAGLGGWLGGGVLFLGLILTRAIFGAFGSASSPAAQAYVADRTHLSQRTEELAALSSAFALGQVLGPGLCALLAAQVGLVAPLVGTSLCAGAAALAIWRLLPEQRKPAAPAESAGGPLDSLRLAGDPRLAGFLIFGFGLSIVTGTLQQVFALFLMDRLGVQGEAGAKLAGAGFMASALTLLVTQMLILPRLKLDARALMASGAVLIAAGAALQIVAPSLWTLIAAQVLQGLGFGLARPGFTGGASMAARADEQGPVAGLIVAINGAGFVFSPVTGAVAYDLVGMNAPLWIALALLGAMFVFALMSRRLRAGATAAMAAIEP
ncbi:MAG TPA: MFS transporter [Caulobacterales bacterium]|nr:MFS transporter [Caulobacterales bacterium]